MSAATVNSRLGETAKRASKLSTRLLKLEEGSCEVPVLIRHLSNEVHSVDSSLREMQETYDWKKTTPRPTTELYGLVLASTYKELQMVEGLIDRSSPRGSRKQWEVDEDAVNGHMKITETCYYLLCTVVHLVTE